MNLVNPVMPQAVLDGDQQFYRVNTFLPPHDLEPGTAADARNKRFVDGRAWPRCGIETNRWGLLLGRLDTTNLVANATVDLPTWEGNNSP